MGGQLRVPALTAVQLAAVGSDWSKLLLLSAGAHLTGNPHVLMAFQGGMAAACFN